MFSQKRFVSVGFPRLYRNSGCIRMFSTPSCGDSMKPATNRSRDLPLQGVRVLDLTRVLAGPYCTMMLADLGADVIKIENPDGGDETREWGPPFYNPSNPGPLCPQPLCPQPPKAKEDASSSARGTRGEATYYLALNRNKRSVAVNMKTKQGLSLLRELVKSCDVVVENYVPGKLDSLGFGYSHVRALQPDIVYASITGYGTTGPYRDVPGYDVMASSLGGLIGVTGSPEAPARPGAALVDIITGLNTQAAVTAALMQIRTAKLQREVEQLRRQIRSLQQQQGQGQEQEQKGVSTGSAASGKGEGVDEGLGVHIEASLYECQIAALANIGQAYLSGGVEGRRRGTQHGSIVPYECFEVAQEPSSAPTPQTSTSTSTSISLSDANSNASRRFVAVGALNNKQFKSLVEAMGRPDLASDPRFATNPLRVRNREELLSVLRPMLASKPASHWVPLLQTAGVPSAPVLTLAEMFAHPQTHARDMVQHIPYPQPFFSPSSSSSSAEPPLLSLIGPALKTDAYAVSIRTPPPFLGQHTHQVLQEVLCLDAVELQRLADQGAIHQHPGFANSTER